MEKRALDLHSEFQAVITRYSGGAEGSNPNSENTDIYETKVLNADESALLNEWHLYCYAPDVGYSSTLKEAGWQVEKLALEVTPSVVALVSFLEGRQHFACSGTIVELSEGIGLIVTVANLVKHQDADVLAEKLMINVYWPNGEVTDGCPFKYDFYHNICLIEAKNVKPFYRPEKSFTSNIGINFDKICSEDVIAMGRNRIANCVWVRTGKIIPKDSELDCEELLVSSCKISKEAVGGPLVNFNGDIIGMNYYQSKETPFIPSFIVSKCLLQLKKSGKVVRPWHGLRARTLYAEGHGTCNGVIIKKIEEHSESSESASDLNVGDIIDRVNGQPFSNAAELGGILLDIGAKHDDIKGISLKFGVSGSNMERAVVVQKSTWSGLNRWPFPKPIIVEHYFGGKFIRDEWFTLDI